MTQFLLKGQRWTLFFNVFILWVNWANRDEARKWLHSLLFFFFHQSTCPSSLSDSAPCYRHVAFVSPSFSQPLFPYYCLLLSLSSSVKTFDYSVVHGQQFQCKEEISYSYLGGRPWIYRGIPVVYLFSEAWRQKLQILMMNQGSSFGLVWGLSCCAIPPPHRLPPLPLAAVRGVKNKRCSPGHPGTPQEQLGVTHTLLPCAVNQPAQLPCTHSRHGVLSSALHIFWKEGPFLRLYHFISHPKQLDMISPNVRAVRRLYPD